MNGDTAPSVAIAEVLALADDYVLGVASQDRERLERVFAEHAQIVGIDEGQLVNIPRDRWIEVVCALDRKGQGDAEYEVNSVVLQGSVAVVAVTTVFGRFSYQDILTVLKYADRARITQKCFHQFGR